jgi:CDP-diacylglycerol--serine O-phosphatidyltransferase
VTDSRPQSPRRRRRLIGISLLPAGATLGNLVCGFFALYCCLLATHPEFAERVFQVRPRVFFERLHDFFPTYIAAGCYLLLLAMIFDTLDGRLARITRRTSEFGAQLDSLADTVSFGVAPALLFVTLLLRAAPEASEQALEVSTLERRIGILCSVLYVSCAVIRLARFNVEHGKKDKAHRAFSGLPSPAAAACVIALLILHETLRDSGLVAGYMSWLAALRWLIAITVFAMGLLMVSRLDYVHVFNTYFRRKHPPTHLVWALVVVGFAVGLGWYSFELLLVAVAFSYALSGIVIYCIRRRQAT